MMDLNHVEVAALASLVGVLFSSGLTWLARRRELKNEDERAEKIATNASSKIYGDLVTKGLEMGMSTAQTSVQGLERSFQLLQAQVEELKADREALRVEVADLKAHIEKLEGKHNGERKRLEGERDEARRRAAELERRIAELEGRKKGAAK